MRGTPAANTQAGHETNPSHDAVLPPSSWSSLFERCGLSIVSSRTIDFTVPRGTDRYLCFVLQRTA